MLLQSAVAGVGVATARALLAHDYLVSGALVQIGATRIPSTLQYWMIWREGHPHESAIRRMHGWLRQQIEASRLPDAGADAGAVD